jgi:putative hydrolase of HD superfamily
MTDNNTRLARQIAFLLEIDKLKSILRRSYLLNESRRENSAEHSWHLAMMALIVAEHANAPVDPLRVLKMLIVHDVVEIDADDTYIYDTAGAADKAVREQAAAVRIFGLLPPDQERELRALWDEFETRQTPEARFAAALDRLMPLLHNAMTQGRSWREHGIVSSQVLELNRHIADGSEALWEYAQAVIAEAVAHGHLPESHNG